MDSMRFMNRFALRIFIIGLLPSICLLVAATNSTATNSNECFPGLFIFGDSFVDVGNAIAAYPDKFAKIEKDPYGKSWPGHGADRFSDGKLLGDLAAWAIGHGPSSAYLRSVQTLLQSGANFAAAGATVLDTYPAEYFHNSNFLFVRTPFTLETQIQWWQRFQVRVDFALSYNLTTEPIPAASAFNSSLNLVLIGATDYLIQYSAQLPDHQILASVPVIVNRIAKNLENLHRLGSKTILVVNLPPLGCTAAFLTMFPGTSGEYDAAGCLITVNTVIRRHNQQLYRAISNLQKRYPKAAFVYGDLFSSVYNVVEYPTHYGFESLSFLKACCGEGGHYNFGPHLTCGGTWHDVNGTTHNVTACAEPERHLTWDGYHSSGAINRIAVLDFFTGKHVYPSNGLLPNNCQANFTLFWANETMTQMSNP